MENETKLKITYELQKLYKTGDRVSNKELKERLQKIYHKCEYLKRATATDILLFGYDFKRCKIRDINNNRINGLELIRI
jgi:hypothetical protein